MLKRFQGYTRSEQVFVLLCLCVIVFGIGARIFLYLRNDSFWLDETYVAYQVTQETFGEIFSGTSILGGQPVSPALFTSAAKISSLIFGSNELGLRFVPFLFGLLSIFFLLFVPSGFSKKIFLAGDRTFCCFSTADPLFGGAEDVFFRCLQRGSDPLCL